MSQIQSVAVVGLGMIGGSVARGLANAGVEVVGYDSNPDHLDAAIADGVVTRRLDQDFRNLGAADIVVIAVDGNSACDVLGRLEPSTASLSLVTDVGSTKRTIVAAAERSSLASIFVGSHPFAGDHRSGWDASRTGLFANETVYLSATSGSTDASLARAEQFWKLLGADAVRMDAAAHDELLAWTSHLPHILSSTFALALAQAGIDKRNLGRGGRDVARLSGGSVDVWTAIAIDNADEMTKAVDAMRHQLDEFGAVLRAKDREGVKSRLTMARDWAVTENSK